MTDVEARLAAFSPEKLALLEQKLRAAPGTARGAIEPRGRTGPVPVSFAQQRMWFLDRLHPGSQLYNVPAVARVGAVDVPVLERALAELVRRHESLRTTFPCENGTPLQSIAPPSPVKLAVADLRAMDASVREAEALRLMAAEAQAPFDLERGPLFRAALLRLADNDHVLLLTLHHIVTDAWSMRLLLREIGGIYDAFLAGKPSPFPDPPIQYADFALWQRELLSGPTLERLLGYWKEALRGAPAVLELPTDRARPRVQTFRGAVHPFALDAETTARLRALAQEHGATLFMTVLALFAVLLHRVCGQDDVPLGSPIANRSRAELEKVVGFFTNTVVLRCRLNGDPSFGALLERVKQVTLGAYAHQDLPFEKLVEELHPGRSLSHNPLFQVLFTLQVANGLAVDAPDDAPATNGMAKFDLSLFVIDAGESLAASFEYNTDLFDAATVERMAGHFRTLVDSVLADPGRRVSRLTLLAPAEREALTAGGAPCSAPAESVVRMFARQAARTPDAPATLHDGNALTYAELDARSGRVAAALRARGVAPESLVALALERSHDVAVAVLGVLKAGAAYVPLDPGYPAARLAYLLEDARPALVVAHPHLAARLPLDGLPVAGVDELEAGGSSNSGTVGGGPIGLAGAAYVIYTSGSTGRPKGVAMTHRALAGLVAWQVERQPRPMATLQYSPLSFDVSFQEIFATLCAGGTLVFVPDEVRREPAELARFIERHGVERLFLPFVGLNQLAHAAGGLAPLPLAHVVTAGEKLQVTDAVARMFGAMPRCTLHNQYGPTETHVVTEHVLDGPAAAWPAEPPIGRAAASAELYVLDRHAEPVPAGVRGELFVGGGAVARGYLRRPALTAERFVPDPFGAPGGRLYRTGDVVRRRSDGTLEFLGRRDDQVKVRGYRVELAEVEAALREHPGVTEAAAAVVEQGGEKRLAGFYTGSADPAELRAFLRERVPEFLVPSSLDPLPSLPLTPSGKADRRALSASAAPRAAAAYAPPRTPVEEALAAIWAEVLGIPRAGIDDHFFDLGGHSLHATQAAARIRDALGVEVPLRALFEAPTIRELAASEALVAARPVEPAPAEPRPPRDAELLARVDELADEEVDAMLRALLAEEAGAEEEAVFPTPPAPAPARAEEAMPRVEELSDAEVDRMLAELLAAEAAENEGGA